MHEDPPQERLLYQVTKARSTVSPVEKPKMDQHQPATLCSRRDVGSCINRSCVSQRRRTRFGNLFAALLLSTVPATANAATFSDNFESSASLSEWAFWPGPGISGSLALHSADGGQYAHLAFNSATVFGQFVNAQRWFPAQALWGMNLEVRHPAGAAVRVLVFDQTGQVLQYWIRHPAWLKNDLDWYPATICFDRAQGYWGGANDGVPHQPIAGIQVDVGPNSSTVPQGFLDFDNVVLLDAPQPIADASSILSDNFETSSLAQWAFWQSPGINGSLTLGLGYEGQGAHLAFAQSTGVGQFVPAQRWFAPETLWGVNFWVRHPAGEAVRLLVFDSSGQVLQYWIIRPSWVQSDQDWYPVTLRFAATKGHWGGANDGIVHQPVAGIQISAGTNNGTVTQGFVDFDDITLLRSPQLAIDPLTTAADFDNYSPLDGLGISVHEADDQELDAIQSAGFNYVRLDILWQAVEQSQGVYDFSYYDAFLTSLQKRGLKPLWLLYGSNVLYTAPGAPPTDRGAVAAFARFAGAAAAHYKGTGALYEMWNEPNGPNFWPNPDPVAYATLAAPAIDQIHLQDSQAQVSTGGIGGMDTDYLARLLRSASIRSADAIAVHPYLWNPDTLPDNWLFLQSMIRSGLSASLPLWSTEWGYSSSYYGDGHSDAARLTQGAHVVREALACWAVQCPVNIYYDIRDDGPDPASEEDNFGLLTLDYKDKPAMTATRYLVSIARSHPLDGIVAAPFNHLNCIRFRNADEIVLALWLDDEEQDPAMISFSQTPIAATDFLGHAILFPAGATSLSVGNTPIYVTFSGRATSPVQQLMQ